MISHTRAILSLAALTVTLFISGLVYGEDQSANADLRLICQVQSLTTKLSNSSISIPVNLTNFVDTISGFQLWINITDPSLIKFKTDSVRFISGDSVYFAKIDTVGTRIKGWEYLQARILDGPTGALINIVGTAETGSAPIRPPMLPGGGILLRLIAETKPALGDSLCDSVTTTLLLSREITSFSDRFGNLVAYTCTGPGDCAFDTTKGLYLNGTVDFDCCGKCADCDANGQTSIGDAVCLINYIFAGGAAPPNACQGDADANGVTTISDAVTIITFIFAGGPPPVCLQ